MTAPALRPYQIDVIGKCRAAVAAGHKRIMLVAPTGSGKTVIAGGIVREDVSAGRRVLFFSHRREITKQTSAKLHAVGVDHGIIQAGFPLRLHEPVQVASVQTLTARLTEDPRSSCPRPIWSSSMRPTTRPPTPIGGCWRSTPTPS